MLSLNEYRNDYRLSMNYQGVSKKKRKKRFEATYSLKESNPTLTDIQIHTTYKNYLKKFTNHNPISQTFFGTLFFC